jgi:hypothetical protein
MIQMDKDILLLCLEANSNGFIDVDFTEDIIRVGRSYYQTDEYLRMWEENGRRLMHNKVPKRIR